MLSDVTGYIYRQLPSQRLIYTPIPKLVKMALTFISFIALGSAILNFRYKRAFVSSVVLASTNKDYIFSCYKKYLLYRDVEEQEGRYTYLNERWFQACKQSDYFTLKELDRTYRVNPNLYDEEHHTALMIAVKSDDLHLVRILRNISGVITNLKDKYQNTAFHLAVRLGNVAIAKELIDDDVLNHKNVFGKTPEMIARENKLDGMLWMISRYRETRSRDALENV